MEINVRCWGRELPYYDLKFNFDNTSVKEENLTQPEVDTIAKSFIEDTLLAPVGYWDVVDKLIESGILNKDQIEDWVLGENSND